MSEFAKQCNANLEMWKARSEEMQASVEESPLISYKANPSSPEDFMSAFPPTLPEYLISAADDSSMWSPISTPNIDQFSADVKSLSTHGVPAPTVCITRSLRSTGSSTPPMSPTESAGSSSYISPRSDVFSVIAPSHMSTGGATPATEASLAIRAAYQAGGRKKSSIRRISWNPDRAAPAFSSYGDLSQFTSLKGR